MQPPVTSPPHTSWTWLVEAALAEDVGPGDATSLVLLAENARGEGRIEAREPLVLAGLDVASDVFQRFDVHIAPRVRDGNQLAAHDVIAYVSGPARGILTAERTALNFLQRLCGIATQTQRFCDAIRHTPARIVDTRKTTPGWRALEKYAVRCGGGTNHRIGLFDGILIKDNHIAAIGSVREAVDRARRKGPLGLRVQVEVESLEDARTALDAGADALLVDNQPPEILALIVRQIGGRIPIEASGGIRLENVAEVAATGVDRISIGALTHSVAAVDIALEWKTNLPS